MVARQCVYDLGRLVLLVSVITQAVTFSAHIADVYGDSKYYSIALVALPMLSVSWRYFAKPPLDRMDLPKFVWLAYALTVVIFQILVNATTDIRTHDSFLLYLANAFTPVLFLLCVVSGCERSLRDADFVMTSGVAIFNAFDVSEAYIAVARIGKNVPSKFWGSLVAVASAMLVWSALEFTIRSQLIHSQVKSGLIASGLHAVHLTLNLALFSLRVVLYINGWMEFSVMIAKNATACVVRLVFVLSAYLGSPPPRPIPFTIPTAPPPMIQEQDCNEYPELPSTPLPARPAIRLKSYSHQDQSDKQLYPSLPRKVHFEEDVNQN